MDRRAWILALALAAGAPAMGACERGAKGTLFAQGFETCAPRTASGFVSLPGDFVVPAAEGATVLAYPLWLEEAADVLVVADGRHFPVDDPVALLTVAIDGDTSAASRSVIDWYESLYPVQHAFRVLAWAPLEAGAHRITLEASSLPDERSGRFVVGANSALSVLVAPRGRVQASALPGTSQNINVTTYLPESGIDTVEGGADRPWVTLLSQAVVNDADTAATAVSLVAGRAAHACFTPFNRGRGDALWGLVADGVCPSTDQAAWGVNDLDEGAELRAPITVQGAYPLAPGQALALDFVASELAFGSDQADAPAGAHENGVCHTAGAVQFLTITGSTVTGSAASATADPPAFCSTYTWRCVGSTDDVEGCPEAGSEVVLASGEIDIPPGHDGKVLFSTQTRIQGDNANGFTTATLFLRVNGERVGTAGVQQISPKAGQASRTIMASYLSAAPDGAPLAPGRHTVQAIVRVDGDDLRYISVPRDLPLVWFD